MTHSIPRSFVLAVSDMVLGSDIDVRRILLDAGVSPMDFLRGDVRISDDQAIRLYNAARAATGDDLLGFGVAPVPAGTFRLLCYAMSSVTTVHEAATRLFQFIRSIPGIPDFVLDTDGPRPVVRFAPVPDPGPTHIKTIIAASLLNRVTSWAIGKSFGPLNIEFPFAEPENAADVALLLGDRVRYRPEADEVRIIVSQTLLEARIEWNEQSILDFLDQAPARLLMPYRETGPLAVRVRRMIEKDLTRDRQSSAEDLAVALSISRPTLRRKLRAEGTSVRLIRDDVLAGRAVTALRDTDDSVESIAKHLGFSETSAFTRAFRRWTGSSPAAFRANVPTQALIT
nr:AraC family transcriptional regulator [Kibdelosporangium sp. MJ126-NF4]CEL15579.1 transcriptional regulator, AraC family [Kibdelosporangium sp. MJ126-NF4]CTQ98243.1 transcriptional regulator, AraC family [Kibdelosporangium sp. MJ126-NF4]